MGSMSPFSMIHLGLSLVRLERSRITVENRPGRKTQCSATAPTSSATCAGLELHVVLKRDSWLASSHLEIYVSLFQPATVISKKIIKLPRSPSVSNIGVPL